MLNVSVEDIHAFLSLSQLLPECFSVATSDEDSLEATVVTTGAKIGI